MQIVSINANENGVRSCIEVAPAPGHNMFYADHQVIGYTDGSESLMPAQCIGSLVGIWWRRNPEDEVLDTKLLSGDPDTVGQLLEADPVIPGWYRPSLLLVSMHGILRLYRTIPSANGDVQYITTWQVKEFAELHPVQTPFTRPE